MKYTLRYTYISYFPNVKENKNQSCHYEIHLLIKWIKNKIEEVDHNTVIQDVYSLGKINTLRPYKHNIYIRLKKDLSKKTLITYNTQNIAVRRYYLRISKIKFV